MKYTRKKFKIPLYGSFNLVVFITENVNDVVKLFMEPDEDSSYEGVFISNVGKDINIVLKEDAKKGVVSHEALHAVFYILNNAGIRYTEESEEAYTYLIEWVVNNITKLNIKHDRRKNKKSR